MTFANSLSFLRHMDQCKGSHLTSHCCLSFSLLVYISWIWFAQWRRWKSHHEDQDFESHHVEAWQRISLMVNYVKMHHRERDNVNYRGSCRKSHNFLPYYINYYVVVTQNRRYYTKIDQLPFIFDIICYCSSKDIVTFDYE